MWVPSTSTAGNLCPQRTRIREAHARRPPPSRGPRTSWGPIFEPGYCGAAAASKWKFRTSCPPASARSSARNGPFGLPRRQSQWIPSPCALAIGAAPDDPDLGDERDLRTSLCRRLPDRALRSRAPCPEPREQFGVDAVEDQLADTGCHKSQFTEAPGSCLTPPGPPASATAGTRSTERPPARS